MSSQIASTALVTGATQGFGRAVTAALLAAGHTVIATGRDPERLASLTSATSGTAGRLIPVRGDVTDPGHQAALAATVRLFAELDLLVLNASELGPSPLPSLAELRPDQLRRIFEVNVVAPHALVQQVLPRLLAAPRPSVVALSSDAAAEPYEGWGGYGSSKAALDQLIAVLGAEQPKLRAYAFDPGDMRTAMHQAAFPGEDISDRPLPESVVPALLRLLDERPASGRYAASALLTGVAA